MQIRVSGKRIDLGSALAGHVEERMVAAIGKYFDRPAEGSVVFSRDAHNFRCDSSVHLATGLTAQAQAVSTDIYAAFDRATERIEKQVRRHKRRLKNHHPARQKKPVEIAPSNAYVLAGQTAEPGESAPDDLQPAIVAETIADMQSLTVGEAVTQMEVAKAPFLVFRNAANGRVNIVHQRDDGSVGWIDSAVAGGA